jgi:hypothetical protein
MNAYLSRIFTILSLTITMIVFYLLLEIILQKAPFFNKDPLGMDSCEQLLGLRNQAGHCFFPNVVVSMVTLFPVSDLPPQHPCEKAASVNGCVLLYYYNKPINSMSPSVTCEQVCNVNASDM